MCSSDLSDIQQLLQIFIGHFAILRQIIHHRFHLGSDGSSRLAGCCRCILVCSIGSIHVGQHDSERIGRCLNAGLYRAVFVQLENAFLPYNRNGVLFPRKINGKYAMLSRPSDSGHTPFGDIFLSESPDMLYWGKHRHVMSKSPEWWESLKIGGGAAPIETNEGWLLFYHGVSGTCNGYVYSIGGAILDKENPSIVKYRCQNFLLTPEEWYEERGFVPNVTFPCATIHDAETGKIAIYYGAADTYVGLAFTTVDLIVDYIKKNSVVRESDTEIGRR